MALLDEYSILSDAMYDEQLKQALGTNLSKWFYQMIDDYMQHKRNIILSIYGKTGGGKSYSALFIAQYIAQKYGMKFDIDHIAYSNQALLDLIAKAKDGETFLLDESVDLEAIGVGSARERMALASIEEVVRQRQINIIYCSPVLRFHVHHYILLPLKIDVQKNTVKHLLRDGITQKPKGFIFTGYPKDENGFLKAYSEKKLKFISNVQKGEVRDPYTQWLDVANEYIKTHWEKHQKLLSNKRKLVILLMGIYRGLTGQEYRNIADIVEMELLKNGYNLTGEQLDMDVSVVKAKKSKPRLQRVRQ